MSLNFTQESLDAVMQALPDHATPAELYALFSTILDTYSIPPLGRVEIAAQIIEAQLELTLAAHEADAATKN